MSGPDQSQGAQGNAAPAPAAEARPASVGNLSADDLFYYEWGRESLKQNLAIANEALRQIITLAAALLGGSVAFLDARVIDPWFRLPVLLGFFLALILAFLGMMPYEGKVALRVPAAIREHKRKALAVKRNFLWSAGASLGAAFAISLVGIVVKQF